MTEHVLSGGYFGGGNAPGASSLPDDIVVHGGYFGGVPVGVADAAPLGWGSDEDSLLIDNLENFGTLAEYQPHDGTPYLLPHGAIFRSQHIEIEPGTGAKITSTEPRAGVRMVEVPEAWSENDLMVVRDRQGRDRLLKVYDVRPDGEVGATVHCHEVKA